MLLPALWALLGITAAPPHILFVVVDDLGWADVGYHRATPTPDVRTPTIDMLVHEGVELDRHYVHMMCTPTRASFQSGRLPIHVTTDLVGLCDPSGAIPRNMTGLAAKLKIAGYATHQVGKWDAGMATPHHTPRGRGYDSSLNYFSHSNWMWSDQTSDGCSHAISSSFPTGGVWDLWDTSRPAKTLRGTGYEEDLFRDRIHIILNGHDPTTPLFLNYDSRLVHYPLQVPPVYQEEFAHIDNAWRRNYHAMVLFLDDQLKNITGTFRELGLWNNTLMVFTSDNGGPVREEAQSECGNSTTGTTGQVDEDWGHGTACFHGEAGANNFPLRGGKYSMWEGGIRATAFASGGYLPQEVRGTKLDGMIHIADWYGTFCELADVPVRDEWAVASGLPDVDSVNIWPLLSGESMQSPRDTILVNSRLLVHTRWKYVAPKTTMSFDARGGPVYPNASTATDPIANYSRHCQSGCLFDLANDLYETTDVALANPGVVAMMQGIMEKEVATIWSTNHTNDPACKKAANDLYGNFYGPWLEVGAPATPSPAPSGRATLSCDVVIAGGSLASAAAAIAAGETSTTSRVCFLEITNWPGGQATTSLVSMMDIGVNYLHFPHNIARSLADLLTTGKMGGAEFNPGQCFPSPKCFAARWAAENLLEKLASLPNVTVFLNTTVVGVKRDAVTGHIVALEAVQRTPTAAHPDGYDRPLSEALADWYSTTPSAHFSKTSLQLEIVRGGVVVEATEFGDVLMLTDGVSVAQGIELGSENSSDYDDHCGNPAALGFAAAWGTTRAPPDPTPPGSDAGWPLPEANLGCLNLRRSWTRNHTPIPWDPWNYAKESPSGLHPGDQYNILCNGGQDLRSAQVMLPFTIARSTAKRGNWAGGMNLTALGMAEERTYAFYHVIKAAVLNQYPTAQSFWQPRPVESGTPTGLAKMLYMRESRRSMHGLGGFKLCHSFMAKDNNGPGGPGCSTAVDTPGSVGLAGTGYRFHDTVGIGAPQPAYGFDLHRYPSWFCTVPSYMVNKTVVPNSTLAYYIPFRALTVADAPNLLVAGKSMATSFLTNAATRLHPTEWASGTAAGAAASLMSALNLSSTQMLERVPLLQDKLRALGVPLEWTGPL